MVRYGCHVSTRSLPNASHPLLVKVGDELNKLRIWLALTSSTLIANVLQDGFTALLSLYERVDDFLHSPHTQQVLIHHRSNRCVDMVLDGSLRLMDVTGVTRDVMLQVKEHVQQTQSALRRRRSGRNDDLSNEIDSYKYSRKAVNKLIHKCRRDLKKMENEQPFSDIEKDEDLVAVITIMREVEVISLFVCEYMLSLVLGSKTLEKEGGWSLVSKLMHRKRVVCESQHHEGDNGIETLHSAVLALTREKFCQDKEVTTALHRLQSLGEIIDVVEGGMDCICRQMIRRRVSLLNIISN